MSSDPGDRDEEAARLRARLDRLSGELKAWASARPPTPEPKAAPKTGGSAGGSAMSLGLRAGSEFVSAVILGLGLGWVLDRATGAKPAFLIVFFLFGVVAGIWNVIRLTSPKGATLNRNSPLSRANSPDKDLPRSAPQAERDASLGGRGAAGGALQPRNEADDDED
jgi:ATP synthase protein I